MPIHHHVIRQQFERGAVVISIDTEQIWGYADIMTEPQYMLRFPNALRAHDKLLSRLCAARISATWFVVGGMVLERSTGGRDPRLAGLPEDWTARIPGGSEASMPLWYRKSFIDRLRMTSPPQEIGLHGGLTHLIWTDRRATREVACWEIAEGINALRGCRIRPCSFSFGRNEEAYYDLLPRHEIRAYRGCPPSLPWRLGRTLPGAVLRAADELFRTAPPPVWPEEKLDGLWNIPGSAFFYPIGPVRARVVGLQSRVERFSRGLEAAARACGIFHFGLHPENLAESSEGFALFDEMLERLIPMRDSGEIEILTMGDVVARMERCRDAPLVPAQVDIGRMAVQQQPLSHADSCVLKQTVEEQ